MHFSISGYCYCQYYCMAKVTVKAANRQLKLNHVGTEVNRESILVLMILTDFFSFMCSFPKACVNILHNFILIKVTNTNPLAHQMKII